jgi:hypothetical protein
MTHMNPFCLDALLLQYLLYLVQGCCRIAIGLGTTIEDYYFHFLTILLFLLIVIRSLQLPTVIAVIDHLAGHATVNADLCLWLTHAIARGGYVDDGSSR